MKKALNFNERLVIQEAVNYLKKQNLPHRFETDLDSIKFFVTDQLGEGVMGKADMFYTNAIHISPSILENLMTYDRNKIPNNQLAMEQVVHELTHIYQFRYYRVFFWLLIIPGIRSLTVEKWANENGSKAAELLRKLYKKLRKNHAKS